MRDRKKIPAASPDPKIINEALTAMNAEELRSLIRDIIPWLDEKTHARLASALVDHAARNQSAWTPEGPSKQRVEEIIAFAEAAKEDGYAEPSEVDNFLWQGINAFLRKDYQAALQIFHSLLIPISYGDIDLGQHEIVDEVLGIDASDCATQYVVSMYMIATTTDRATEVYSAIQEVRGVGSFYSPLKEIERIAVETLPEYEQFLIDWRALIEEKFKGERRNDWETDKDRWLREVVQRKEGAEGLAKVAQATKRAEDLDAWCRALVEAKDWKGALSSYEQAAQHVVDKKYWGGDFLDGAALATQELGLPDFADRLEQAWKLAPSLLRLRRWLGSSKDGAVVKQRAAAAIDVCPNEAYRQQGFLYILIGNLEAAARLLGSARGLGWSDSEHPGHLLFPIFCRLLGAKKLYVTENDRPLTSMVMDINEQYSSLENSDDARLANPSIDEIIETAAIGKITDASERAVILKAMRAATEKRIEGVIENKRRRYYGHAALLAAICVTLDSTADSSAWMNTIRDEYRRYPAFQRELARHVGSSDQKPK